jgi:hypothetical protein
MPRPVSLGRALARLIKQHGYDTVAARLGEIAAAPPRLVRRRGRPRRPYYDDTALVQAAAARWRRAGGRRSGGDVWPFLHEVAGGDSAARRLLRRLDEWGADGCQERGIGDFNAALWRARLKRALGVAVDGPAEDALHTLAAGYRRRYAIAAIDAEVLLRSIPDLAARLDREPLSACATWHDAWATVRHLSARRFYC